MNELPEWFSIFSTQQIEGVDIELERLELKSLEELQVIFIKAWSVIKIFSKIVVILFKKREYLQTIEPELDGIENKIRDINRYKSELQELIFYYKNSIDGYLL